MFLGYRFSGNKVKKIVSILLIIMLLISFSGSFLDLKAKTVMAQSLLPVVAITAVGDLSLAIKQNGTLWKWGAYGDYEPFQIGTESGFLSIDKNLALKSDGTVWRVINEKIEKVPGLDNVQKIASGGQHYLALKEDGTVWTWGSNQYSVLGYQTPSSEQQIPKQVPELFEVKEIAASWHRSAAIKQDGTIWYWGSEFDLG